MLAGVAADEHSWTLIAKVIRFGDSTRLEVATVARKCVDCDGILLRGAAYCHRCGHPVSRRRRSKRKRRRSSQSVAAVGNGPAPEADEFDREFDPPYSDEEHASGRTTAPGSRRQRRRQEDLLDDTPERDRDPAPRVKRRRPRQGTRIKTPRETVRAADDEPERELWRDTYSAKGLVNYWLIVGLATVLLPVVAVAIQGEQVVWQLVIAAIGAAWATMFTWIIYLKLDVHYQLTNQRFLHKSGILTRHTRRIEVIDIDDLNIRQSIIERIINVGTIEIISSDRSDPVIELPGIDNVEEVAYVMDEARRAERLRRGLHIESI